MVLESLTYLRTLSAPQASKRKQDSKGSDKRKNWALPLIESLDFTVATLNDDLKFKKSKLLFEVQDFKGFFYDYIFVYPHILRYHFFSES